MVPPIVKQEATLTLAATTRVLPILAILWSASLWAASQYFVTTDKLEATATQQRVIQLEDKMHEIDNKEARGVADDLDLSDKARYVRERDRLMRKLNR